MTSIEQKGYWDERAIQINAEIASDAQFSASVAGTIESLQRKLAALYADRGAHSDEEIAAVQAEYDALIVAEGAQVAAEWTREVTIARRAAWNEIVKSGKLSKAGKVNFAALRMQEREQGWTVEGLKKAVQQHGL